MHHHFLLTDFFLNITKTLKSSINQIWDTCKLKKGFLIKNNVVFKHTLLGILKIAYMYCGSVDKFKKLKLANKYSSSTLYIYKRQVEYWKQVPLNRQSVLLKNADISRDLAAFYQLCKEHQEQLQVISIERVRCK